MKFVQSLFICSVCAAFTIVSDVVFFGDHWPDHSASGWAVFAAGLIVIALAFTIAESLVERRRRARAAEG